VVLRSDVMPVLSVSATNTSLARRRCGDPHRVVTAMRFSLSAPTAHLCQRSIHLEVAQGAAALKGETTRLAMKWRVLITPRSSFSPQTSGNRREIPDTRRVVRQREATRLQAVCGWTPPPPSACHAERRGFESVGAPRMVPGGLSKRAARVIGAGPCGAGRPGRRSERTARAAHADTARIVSPK
jgi:hypothetical protein